MTPRPRARLALGVLLGHALLVMGLWHAVRPARPVPGPGGPAASPVWLRWWTSSPSPVLPARLAPTAAANPPKHSPTHRSIAKINEVAEARPTARPADLPAPASGPGLALQPGTGKAVTASLPALPPADAASQPLPPLDLRLRALRPSAPNAADLVRNDPRRQPPPGRDDRLAQALGSNLGLHEEQRGDVRRFRRGTACVDTRPSRESQINPFGPSAGNLPRLAQGC